MHPPPFPEDEYVHHRPSTARPTTAGGSLAEYDYPTHHHGQQYGGQGYQIEEEYEEESEDEDVFAFLPPSTAEQQQQREEEAQQQQQEQQQQTGLAYPSPTYSPYGPGKHPYEATSAQFGFDPGAYGGPPPPMMHAAPGSPPSTDSQNHSDPYRMKRLNTAPASVAALPPSTTDSQPSRQVHISLPNSAMGTFGLEKTVSVSSDADLESFPHHQGRIRHGNLNSAPYSHGRSTRATTAGTSGIDTVSIGPSVIDEDVDGTSREGSIK
jgi:hypothetical protein